MKYESAQAFDACPPGPHGDAVWMVKTRSGVRTWSLDELDAAFQRNEVDANTYVFTSGMTEWTPLGVIANLEAAAANDTDVVLEDDEGDAPDNHARTTPTEPPRSRPVATPAALADGGSFAPTSVSMFGDGGASMWASITTPNPELQTGLRFQSAVLPFRVRRALGKLLDVLSRQRAEHPRWAAAGPWLFGAALSGIFIVSLYGLANTPAASRLPARSVDSAVAATASDSDAPSRASDARIEETTTRSPSPSPSAAELDVPSAASAAAVVRPNELSFAPSRSDRQLTRPSSAKAKPKATGERNTKARATRKARSKARRPSLAE
ncbi:MAG TPA: GYF domain-containing protein [Polyangiaceae bacterium]|nr:GYF domain-containing protein [Polyangiaceae bacterium]